MIRGQMFDNLDSFVATLERVLQNKMVAEFIDDTDRRRIEQTRALAQIAGIISTGIRHDGSTRCPVIPGQPIILRHKLNDVLLRSAYPERLDWRDVIAWQFEWKEPPC